MLVTITDHDRGWLVGQTESVTFEPNLKFNKSFFGSISLLAESGYEWSLCKNIKSESVKIICTTTVPADELLVGPLVAQGYWADCEDGYILGPILCDAQGYEISQSFIIYNSTIPTKPITSIPDITYTTTTTITTTVTTTPTRKSVSTSKPSSSSLKTSANLAIIFGILVGIACLVILGFVIWAKNHAKREKNLHDLLDFEIDRSHNKPFPRTIPKAESPFPDRPVYLDHQLEYPVGQSYQSQGYSMVNSEGRF
jgi:hypothetical protein